MTVLLTLPTLARRFSLLFPPPLPPTLFRRPTGVVEFKRVGAAPKLRLRLSLALGLVVVVAVLLLPCRLNSRC